MTRRDDDLFSDAATERFETVGSDDAFLDALARGDDPSQGSDRLAALFLDLKDEVDQPMPPPPSVMALPRIAERPAPMHPAPAEQAGVYDELAQRRTSGQSERRGSGGRGFSGPGGHKVSPWLSGFVGAAAATVLVVGSGAALYNATPGSPLWGPASAVFGDRTAVVELASTLDELEAANQEGDAENFSALLRQARALVNSLNATGSSDEQGEDGRLGPHPSTDPAPTATVTVTVPIAPEPEGGAQSQEPPAPAAPAAPAPQAGTPDSAAPAPTLPQVPPAPSAQPVRPAPSQQPTPPAPPSSAPRPVTPTKPPQVNPPAPDPQVPPTPGAGTPDQTLNAGPAAGAQAGAAGGSSA